MRRTRSHLDSVARCIESLSGPWAVGLLGYLPLFVTGLVFYQATHGWYMADLHTFREAAQDLVSGRPLYPPADPAVLSLGDKFVYPPPVAYVFIPFAALPYSVATYLFACIVLAATLLVLYVLDVHDWRCYGATLLMAPTMVLLGAGAITSLLALGIALAWRYRDRPRMLAPVLAAVIVAKLFLWPLLVWLLVTRRVRAAVWTAGLAVLGVLGSWAVIGFEGLHDYPELLATLADTLQKNAYSASGLGLHVGLSPGTAQLVGLALGGLVCLACVKLRSGPEGDRRVLIAALAASLFFSPLVWMHYFVLLLIPLALTRPRLTPLWLAPLAFWATPFPGTDGLLWRTTTGLAVATGLVGATLARSRSALGTRQGGAEASQKQPPPLGSPDPYLGSLEPSPEATLMRIGRGSF